MELPTDHTPKMPNRAFEDMPISALSALDPDTALDLHRAINERRAQLENPELLRSIRAL